jgi:hypothetical protein
METSKPNFEINTIEGIGEYPKAVVVSPHSQQDDHCSLRDPRYDLIIRIAEEASRNKIYLKQPTTKKYFKYNFALIAEKFECLHGKPDQSIRKFINKCVADHKNQRVPFYKAATYGSQLDTAHIHYLIKQQKHELTLFDLRLAFNVVLRESSLTLEQQKATSKSIKFDHNWKYRIIRNLRKADNRFTCGKEDEKKENKEELNVLSDSDKYRSQQWTFSSPPVSKRSRKRSNNKPAVVGDPLICDSDSHCDKKRHTRASTTTRRNIKPPTEDVQEQEPSVVTPNSMEFSGCHGIFEPLFPQDLLQEGDKMSLCQNTAERDTFATVSLMTQAAQWYKDQERSPQEASAHRAISTASCLSICPSPQKMERNYFWSQNRVGIAVHDKNLSAPRSGVFRSVSERSARHDSNSTTPPLHSCRGFELLIEAANV